MGANQSYLQAVPKPVPQGLAAFAPPGGSPHTYVAKQPLTLHVRESMMMGGGDSFVMTDARTGHVWFKMKGKILSLSQRKVMEDAAGKPVFTMRHRKLTFRGTISVWPHEQDSGTPALEASQSLQMYQAYKEVTISATAVDLISRRPVQLTLKGDMRGKAGVILLGDSHSTHIIAKMEKPTTMTSILAGAQEYLVTIAAGVDAALISALCVIWDEAVHDGNSSTAGFGSILG